VSLEGQRCFRHQAHLLGSQHADVTGLHRYRYVLQAALSSQSTPVQLVRHDRRLDLGKRFHAHEVAVNVASAIGHRSAEAQRCFDEDTLLAGGGVPREGHARSLSVDHHLHHHGHDGLVRRLALPRPVEYGPLRPERRPAIFDGLQQELFATDGQERVLLAGKGCCGQVLGRGRGPHRHSSTCCVCAGYQCPVGA